MSASLAVSSGLAKGRGLLAGFTSGQKAVTGVAVLALLLGGFFFASWAGRPTYAPAFTNLAAEDASAITSKLTEDKQAYRLADGGSTVEVPRSDVYDVRIKLSGAGLPAGSTGGGYALMDKQGLTSSDFQQQVTYKRALEGELQKTIEAIDGVQGAIVHLVIPAQDVFTDDASKPTASVLVKSMPSKPIKASQVQAIVHLVSSSVEGLTPEDVTVAGADGRVLNAAGEDGSAMDDAHSTQVKAYEDATAEAVQSMLTGVVGPGHAVVRVDADLSYDQKSTTTERYVTDKNAVPLSSSMTRETYKGAGTPVGGVLGPDNIGVPNGAGSETEYIKESEQKQNAVGKITEQTKAAPGQVRRQSVAVLLDAKTAGKLDESEVEKLVVAAAGIVPGRGDKVQVSTMSFDTSAADEAKKALDAEVAAKQKNEMMSLAKTGFVVVVVLSVLIGLVRRSRKEERTPLELPAGTAGQITVEDLRELAAMSQHELGRSNQLALDPAESELVAIRSDIGQLIEEQPDEVARLLRGWLADRRS